MALAVQSSSNVGQSVTWIQVPAPSGVVAGDVLIAFTWTDNRGSAYNLTAPADWLLIGSGGVPTSGFVRAWLKVATATEPTLYMFGGSSVANNEAVICRINGVVSNTTFSMNIATSANTANHSAQPVTTVSTDSIILCFFGGVVNTSSTWAVPVGFTNRGLGLVQSTYLQGIVASKASGAGSTGVNVATTTAWNGVGLGDITATVEMSQFVSIAADASSTIGFSSSVSAVVGGGPTLPASIKYKYEIDWTGNGNFTDSGDDVSSRIMADPNVSIEYGRDKARSLSPMKFGISSFELNNISRDYYPDNSSGPLFGRLIPSRDNRITATFLGNDFILWRGHLDDFQPDPTPGHRVLSVTCIDDLSKLDAAVSTPLYTGITTGQAIHYILDAIGFPTALRDIDPGYTIIPYWWEDGTNAWDAINKVIYSEGPPSFVTMDGNGNVVFRDRMHRATHQVSIVSQATFRDAGADPRFSWPLGYDAGLRDIINSVTISVPQRTPQPQQVVWSTDATIDLAANEVRSFIATSSDPFINAQVPIAGTDFNLIFGAIQMGIGRSSGQSTVITIREGTGVASQVVGLALQATPLKVTNTAQVSASDSASIASFGLKPYPYPASWVNSYDAVAIAAIIIAQRAQRAPTVTVRLTGGNNTITVQQLARNLSDRVTVIDAETGINGDFYIEQIKHSISGAGNRILVTSFGCEKLVSGLNDPASIFIFGSGTNGKFNTNTFGY